MIEIFQNIRQFYDFVAPCPELADHIEFYAETALATTQLLCPQTPLAVTMFASWTPTFYVNLGAAYTIDLAHTRHQVKADEHILLLRNNMVTRYNLPTDNIFTVKFQPGGLEAVLGFSQGPLANQLTNLLQVLPRPLLWQLKQPISLAERVEAMQKYLLSWLLLPKKDNHYRALVYEAIGDYQATGLQLQTCAVAERLFVTSKTINRYFHRVVGLSPKQYFSVLRVRTALTAYVADPASFAPCAYGYFDQSHFNKAVRQFTGQTLAGHGR